jgi:hypothetical protein
MGGAKIKGGRDLKELKWLLVGGGCEAQGRDRPPGGPREWRAIKLCDEKREARSFALSFRFSIRNGPPGGRSLPFASRLAFACALANENGVSKQMVIAGCHAYIVKTSSFTKTQFYCQQFSIILIKGVALLDRRAATWRHECVSFVRSS